MVIAVINSGSVIIIRTRYTDALITTVGVIGAYDNAVIRQVVVSRVAFKSTIREQISAASGLLAQRGIKRRNAAVRRCQTSLCILHSPSQRVQRSLICFTSHIRVCLRQRIAELGDTLRIADHILTDLANIRAEYACCV